MAEVNLQPITTDNYLECLGLRVDESQSGFVATNARSLAEAKADPTLTPLAIYDGEGLGHLPPDIPVPMVGFVMYERKGGVGFILRLMIDRAHQRRGYGRAAAVEAIRRLRLYPDVQMIATSHQRGNEASARLFRSLGFVPWEIAWAKKHEAEVFLRLAETRLGPGASGTA